MAAAVVFLCLATPTFAHRLDEYLQATMIDVGKSRILVEIRLTPGVEVFPRVLAAIDRDGDGTISLAEQQAYAGRVIGDLSLSIDRKPEQLRLISSKFPPIEDMKDGLGEIVLECDAQVPRGCGSRSLVFENHHQSGISAYLVNCLSPSDPEIRINRQSRNYDQSFYRLDYSQPAVRAEPLPSASWSTLRVWLGVNALVFFAWAAMIWHRRRAGLARVSAARP